MNKQLLTTKEIFDVIVNCYQTDSDLTSKFHILAPASLSSCIDRTVSDLMFNDVNVYKLTDGDEFIGYFGDIGSEWLTGFFVMPSKRKSHSVKVWETIKSHFNGEFKTSIFAKNTRAAKYLKKNGCIVGENLITAEGLGTTYVFVKENN